MRIKVDIFDQQRAFLLDAADTVFVGVDPGVTGAMALYDGSRACVMDIPVTVTKSLSSKHGKRHKKTSRMYDFDKIAAFFTELCAHVNKVYLVVERGQPMPTDTAMTGYAVGGCYQSWLMLAACKKISILPIRPAQWKKLAGLLGRDKEVSRASAIEKFPQLLEYLNTKSSHNRAEALLLAVYGRQIICQNPKGAGF